MLTDRDDQAALGEAPAERRPLLPCDVVMAGGVTSGIIYPGAVAAMARRFRFKCLGGTSVGAIAAAVTAAAEYGRQTGSNADAFEYLATIPSSLGERDRNGRSRLFSLFVPDEKTRPFFDAVSALMGRGSRLSKAGRLLWKLSTSKGIRLWVGIAAAIAAAPIPGLLATGHPVVATISIATALLSVVIVASLLALRTLNRGWLPAWLANGYGLCRGNARQSQREVGTEPVFESLTPWMHRVIQNAAGRPREAPLTFGDLWKAGPGDGAADGDHPGSARTIELSMIASDISRNRSVQLPFIETPSPLYVSLTTLADYFPTEVVEWMRTHPGEYADDVEQRSDVIRLPRPPDLPIVFGARLSLSFPILLAALPLLTPDFAKGRSCDGKIPLRKVWFSDGGLTSNFPVHFFDGPVPSRPTFCLNLIDYDTEIAGAATPASPPGSSVTDEESPELGSGSPGKVIEKARAPERSETWRSAKQPEGDPQPGDPVWSFLSMARGNRLTPLAFTAFDTDDERPISAFLKTLLNTARFWNDNQLLSAPGIRDRVVNIALRSDEGGLNLDMDPEVIGELNRRGVAAGMLISARFDPFTLKDPETGDANIPVFANHRWVRYRNFMAAFEDIARRFVAARKASDAAATERGESTLDKMIEGGAAEKLGYPIRASSRRYYKASTSALEDLGLQMAKETASDPDATFDPPRMYADGISRQPPGAAPRPKMRLGLRPMVDNDPRSETAELPSEQPSS